MQVISVRRFAPAILILVGAALLVSGAVLVFAYFHTSRQVQIQGNQVVDLTRCSGGYASGECPVTDFAWAGVLVNPAPNGSLRSIWGLNVDQPLSQRPLTCGLPATYSTNIPVSGAGPMYMPVGSGLTGVTASGSTVYVYTGSRYTLADSCGGDTYARLGNVPVKVNAQYSTGSTQVLQSSTFGYDFSQLTGYWSVIEAGLFLAGLGVAVYLVRLQAR